MPPLSDIVSYLDAQLGTRSTPDYPGAVNGLQLENSGKVTRVATAVDASQRTIDGAITVGADLLVVHHGLFWKGLQPVTGPAYRRLRALVDHDVAVYSSHLPLDRHPTLGNNALLAAALGLTPGGEFARFETIAVGVRGTSDVLTSELFHRASEFAREHDTIARASAFETGRRTRSWGICTGGGASADTLAEAAESGIDTLIVGEGPHWTAVDAPERGLVIIYAGHYATETLGVRALGTVIEQHFGVPWSFVAAPTGM